MRLDELARALYAAAPGDFVAMRDRFVREAREAGERELAARLRALRRPTQSAWLVNLLVREHPELVEELLAIGAEFRGGELTRQRMTELTAARRDLLHRVVEQAAALSEAADLRFSEDKAREIEATFGAAMADQAAADQLQEGRLTTALSYSGFGPQLQLVPSPATGSGDTAAGSRRADAADRDALRERRGEARAAVRSAERALLDHTRAMDKATARRDRLTQRRDDLRTELELVQSRLAVVDGELEDAEQTMRERTEAVEATQRELDAAKARVDELN